MRYIADIEDRYGHFNSIEFDAPNDNEAKKIAKKHGFAIILLTIHYIVKIKKNSKSLIS